MRGMRTWALAGLVVAALGACGGSGGQADTGGPADTVDARLPDTIDAAADVPATDGVSEADAGADQPHIVPTDVLTGEVTLGKQSVAGVCSADDDCVDGWCVPDYYGGYCSSACSVDGDCPQDTVYGSVCLQSPENGQKMCWKVCQSAYDCRSDQMCVGSVPTFRMCVPKCQPGTCKMGQSCNVDTGVCDYVSTACEPEAEACNGSDDDCNGLTDEGCGPKPNLVPGVDALDLGRITAGGGGLTYEVGVPVPGDTTSMTLVALAADNAYLMFWSLVDPSGLGLLNGSDIYQSLNRTYPGEGATALLVPNNPSVSVLPGNYRFSLYKDGDVGPVTLTALYKRGAAPSTGKLGLNFYFVGLSWINAASASNDATFQKVLQKVVNVYAQVGVTVDDLQLYDIGGADGAKFHEVELSDGPDDERHQLLKLSAAHPASPNVNVFFVDDITTADDYSGYFDVLGIAGGIPGPPLFQGTNGAGVLVDLSEYKSGWMSSNEKAQMYGEVIAHEVGHQLGLFHSSEQNGKTHDQLSDTAECTKDPSGDGLVDGYECWTSGATNLMFWQATGAVELSSQQGFVLRRNPAIR